ncbi:MAG TPA: hypothetical protein VN240_10590, partial [Propylenella sp.]|nr:hypothetical protein [Propylenella sp.]
MRTALLAASLALGLLGAAGARAQECDRACLEGAADGYLAAMLAKDVSRLPLARDVRFAENGAR